jgi:glycosyltransferase involved in cell wall biosynthesis
MNQSIRDIFKEKRVCVLVPTFSNSGNLRQVLRNIVSYTPQVIVVNDGSTDNTETIVKEFPSIDVVSYSKNWGKGFALRQGFAQAVTLGYNYAIAIDSDGQHYVGDLPKFLTKLQAHPNAIIIGSRNMDQTSVPGKSSFSNKFSNFWFWVETGFKCNDTQSGYRLYPVKALQQIHFFSKKYEFEMEVIVRGAWHGLEVVEVPVKVFDATKGSHASNFRSFRDSNRINVLNIFLVSIAFLYIKPRNFFLSLKKKISDRSFGSFFSIPEKLTKLKQSL